ncbi:MAG TPA: glycoside hydrolase family 3 N-terminal domain-containing protein [Chitinophagaceae bacterium]|nr:glycoside hydrolase family 3 N-terminal domain-containing protein [Chitinophagaceae bacterium]
MNKFLITLFFFSVRLFSFSQVQNNPSAQQWADSVFNTLSDDERITQLMVLRESEITKDGVFIYDSAITEAIEKYNIGGIVLFQGGPVKQANFINRFQSIAKTPLMVCIDAEWGLGMRVDSIIPLNHQMMLGAVQDPSIMYNYGKLVARQCKRMGIQVNFAPVVDINNNPNNPVINDRSFGEDKYKVARNGIAYMKGLQDEGVLACAKHFPGHGDVSVDSHRDLPVINKSMEQLDSLELYPFEQMFAAGAGSVMIAHLYIPAIDTTANTATSLSKNNVTGLLREKLNYQGLTFTDALGMQGVAKYFPGGEIAAQSLIAGNDMLCLPADVPSSIVKIKEAIQNNKLSWDDIYAKCKKVLLYKYQYGVAKVKPINTDNLVRDLNGGIYEMKQTVAENAITVLGKKDIKFFPLQKPDTLEKNIAYLGIGISGENTFSHRMKDDYNADAFYFDYLEDAGRILSTVELIKNRYKSVVIGIHNYARYPANNFGISKYALDLVDSVLQSKDAIIFDFGNPYALKNFCNAPNLVACYEDDSITQRTAINLLEGDINAKGKLPVTVCDAYQYGSGIITSNNVLAVTTPEQVGLDATRLSIIDSIANDGIAAGAMPGCVVLVARNGKIVFEKAYGTYNYNKPGPVALQSIYDMASVTKICATTISVMKLYDEGKIKLNKTLGDYLPWVRGSNKAKLKIRNILLHQAGLVGWIPFYEETINSENAPIPSIYSKTKNDSFSIRVAENLYMRNDWRDTMYRRILKSKLTPQNKYIYSDNDFIFMGKIVEQVSGLPLEKYVAQNFYEPMGLTSTGFLPREKFDTVLVAPTENEKIFRMQHIHGDVHDPGAAMFGGVAGHAGLFSDAQGIAAIMQMLLNGGAFDGKKYLEEKTIKLFSAYNSPVSRRGLGFDKPEKDNATRAEPYPAKSVSPQTFGHTGFTGTCTWADPKSKIVFVFLSNRVNSDGGNSSKLLKMNIRGKIQEAIYDAIIK